MPGYEVFGLEERNAINEIFDLNGGVLFAHGFDSIRNGVYKVREFEKNFSTKFKSQYSQAVSSGSAAVKVALIAAGIKEGDEIIVPSFTFIATIEAILEIGAVPIIIDIDNSLNLDTSVIENSITKNTKALLPVHMMGAPVDMVGIQSTAKKYNLIIVEDNAQCCGGTYQGKLLGTFGQASAFSFDGGKTLMTGEGGMVLTNDEKVFIRSRAYHDHGHAYNTSVGRGEDFAIMNGFNYRMTELQGAIGIEQLKKLDFIIDEQRKNKKKIKEQIYHLPLEFRKINDEGEIGDTIVFFLPTLEITQKFMDKMLSLIHI